MPMRKRSSFQWGALGLAVALGAANPARASQSVTTVYSFDASGNETLVSFDRPQGYNCGGGVPCLGPTLFTVTNDAALSFNPATSLSQQIAASTTEIIGTLNGGGAIYDLTFQAAFNSPVVQAGFQAAINALEAAGGPGVTITGPQLKSSKISTVSASSTTYTVGGLSTSSVVTTTIGPGPINAIPALVSSSNYDPVSDTQFTTTVLHPELAPSMPGVYTVCTPTLFTAVGGAVTPVAVGTALATAASCAPNNGGIYTLVSGQTDINVDLTTTFAIDTTTTTTTTVTTATIYDINGVTSGLAPTVPEPRSWLLLAIGLGTVSALRCRNSHSLRADRKPLPL